MLVVFIAAMLASNLAFATVGPYCGAGPDPSVSNCQAAVNKISDSGDYYSAIDFTAYDCKVSISNVDSMFSISGADAKAIAQAVLNKCGSIGWGAGDSGQNVSIQQCQVCEYGTCAVCDAPARRDRIVHLGERTVSAAFKTTSKQFDKRQGQCGNSPPGLDTVQCCGNAGVTQSSCDSLADSIKGQSFSTPFTKEQDGCEMAVEGKSSGVTFAGDDVAQRMIDDAQACQGGGVVGEITDNPPDRDYTLYFGKFCNEFGFGEDGCVY